MLQGWGLEGWGLIEWENPENKMLGNNHILKHLVVLCLVDPGHLLKHFLQNDRPNLSGN